MAVKLCKMDTDTAEFDEPANRPERVILRDMILQRKRVEQRRLRFLLRSQHRDPPISLRKMKQRSAVNQEGVFNGIGRQQIYSDVAIQTCLSMKVLFGRVDIGAPLVRATMSTRQTTGFVESLRHLVGLDLAVPDFSTLSCRQKTLAVNIPYRGSKGPLCS